MKKFIAIISILFIAMAVIIADGVVRAQKELNQELAQERKEK